MKLFFGRMSACWINQPSTIQSCHDRHGELGYATLELDGGAAHFYPIDPTKSSMRCPVDVLSAGWPVDKVQHIIARLYPPKADPALDASTRRMVCNAPTCADPKCPPCVEEPQDF